MATLPRSIYDRLAWRTSSYSSQGTYHDCVETAPLPAGMAVRDSKNPDGPAFAISGGSWRRLLTAIRADRT